jgi:hypothetical protein
MEKEISRLAQPDRTAQVVVVHSLLFAKLNTNRIKVHFTFHYFCFGP